MDFEWLDVFGATVLGSQEELWELPVHGDITIKLVGRLVARTVAVRARTGAYGSDYLKSVGIVPSRNNYLQFIVYNLM